MGKKKAVNLTETLATVFFGILTHKQESKLKKKKKKKTKKKKIKKEKTKEIQNGANRMPFEWNVGDVMMVTSHGILETNIIKER